MSKIFSYVWTMRKSKEAFILVRYFIYPSGTLYRSMEDRLEEDNIPEVSHIFSFIYICCHVIFLFTRHADTRPCIYCLQTRTRYSRVVYFTTCCVLHSLLCYLDSKDALHDILSVCCNMKPYIALLFARDPLAVSLYEFTETHALKHY